MVALEYFTEGDTDGVYDVSNSSEEELTLEAKEFSIIWLSDHALKRFIDTKLQEGQPLSTYIVQVRALARRLDPRTSQPFLMK